MKPNEKENALSAFSGETLTEMGMENIEGGKLADLNVNKCGSTDNCGGCNSVPGCSCTIKTEPTETSVV